MRKFEFKKSYEEIDIAGEVYRVDLSDEKVKMYQKAFKSFYEEGQKISEVDIEKLSDGEQEELLSKQLETMKLVTETVLGKGTFEKLYELSGRSTVNYMDLLLFVSEVMQEKAENLKEDARKKYVKKKK